MELTDIFKECRERVTARTIAERYGYTPNRAGFIRCPFHGEDTPSLKLYQDGGWYCFGCKTGGNSIDFASRLFNLPLLETVKQLDHDFGLNLSLYKPLTAAKQRQLQEEMSRRQEISWLYNAFETWRMDCISKLCDCLYVANAALKGINTPADIDNLTFQQSEAIRHMESIENLANELEGGTVAQQLAIFKRRREYYPCLKKILDYATP